MAREEAGSACVWTCQCWSSVLRKPHLYLLCPRQFQPAIVIPWKTGESGLPYESGKAPQSVGRGMLGMSRNSAPVGGDSTQWWWGSGGRPWKCSLMEEKVEKETASDEKLFFLCNNLADPVSLEWRYSTETYLSSFFLIPIVVNFLFGLVPNL